MRVPRVEIVRGNFICIDCVPRMWVSAGMDCQVSRLLVNTFHHRSDLIESEWKECRIVKCSTASSHAKEKVLFDVWYRITCSRVANILFVRGLSLLNNRILHLHIDCIAEIAQVDKMSPITLYQGIAIRAVFKIGFGFTSSCVEISDCVDLITTLG